MCNGIIKHSILIRRKSVSWTLYVSEKGSPVIKEQLLNNVQLLMGQLQKENSFTNNRPGRHWYEAFIRRHSQLSHQIAQNLTTIRASVSEDCSRNGLM